MLKTFDWGSNLHPYSPVQILAFKQYLKIS